MNFYLVQKHSKNPSKTNGVYTINFDVYAKNAKEAKKEAEATFLKEGYDFALFNETIVHNCTTAARYMI